MRALALVALLGGDSDNAEKFQAWVKVHPLVIDADGGASIGCANGNRPRAFCVGGEYKITCESKDGGR